MDIDKWVDGWIQGMIRQVDSLIEADTDSTIFIIIVDFKGLWDTLMKLLESSCCGYNEAKSFINPENKFPDTFFHESSTDTFWCVLLFLCKDKGDEADAH